MGINIASLFATIGVNTDPLNKGLGGAKSQLSGFAKELAKSTIGTLSLATATYKAGKAVIDSIRDWADYADSMRLSAQMAGVTTEEMSRLTQAADDFRVPMEVMQRSMEMALKNGFTPTIDNLAALSDHLLAINDPALRAAEASKIFGKSYADMMPFLLAGGEAIRDVTDGISDSLVVTAEAAQQAKEYKDALDALGDAWVGLKNKIGQFAVPALTDVINNLAGQPTELMKLQDVVTAAAKKAFDDKKISAEEYQAVLDNVSTSTGTYTEYVSKLNFILGILNKTNGEAVDTTEVLTEAELEAANAAIAAAEAQAELNAEVANLKSLDANYKGIIDLAYEYSDILADQQDLQIERDKLISQGWSDQSAKVKDLDAQIAGLDATMAELANKVTLDMFEATIAIGGVTEAELSAYMQMAIDMGLMSEKGAQAAMDAYGSAIATINSYEIDEKTGNVVIDAKEAYATLVMIQQMQIADKNANINIFTNYYNTTHGYDPYENLPPPSSGGSNPSPGTGAPALPPKPGKKNLGRAAGGDVIGGTPYIVGERGPELFVPNANGQIIPNNELSDYATGAVINNYNLTMPTTARAEDVRMAFELMEAWNR